MSRIVLFAGGVGGAKAALGLYLSRHASQLTIVGNVGDDEAFHGLWVSPDMDTLTYTLAGKINRQQGWGLEGDSQVVLNQLKALGCDTWMQLGDLDFATHIFRSQQKALGKNATQIALTLAQQLGVKVPLLPVTNHILQTKLRSSEGWLSFQDYFVRQRCAPEIIDIRYQGCEQARVTNEVLSAVEQADIILFAPSNPLLSIAPMLSIKNLQRALKQSHAYKLAISPLIGGKTVKGPADRLMLSMGYSAGNEGIGEFYQHYADGLVIHQQDQQDSPLLRNMGLDIFSTNTLMQTDAEKSQLMELIVGLAQQQGSLA